VSPDKQFCAVCGAPSAATPAVAGFAQPAAPPARSGSSAVKIILIIVAIFAGLGLLALGTVGYGIWRVSRAVHMSGNGDKMSLSTSNGTLDIDARETYSASDLGTDVYPGAESVKGGMKMKTSGGSLVTGIFVTSDSKEQVVDYYKGKLGSDASVMDMPEAAILTLKKGEQESVLVTVTSKASQHDGKTQISITHSTSNKPS
jgi:hypothetical protein